MCLSYLSFAGIIPSVIATIISYNFPTFRIVIMVLVLMNFVVFAITIYRLFDFRMYFKSKKMYYLYNLSAISVYCIFAIAGSAVIDILNVNNGVFLKVYTYIFYNFKTFHYISYNGSSYAIGVTLSVLCYSALYLFVVAVFPLFINKKKLLGVKKNKNTDTKNLSE